MHAPISTPPTPASAPSADDAALIRYEALTPPERLRAARLVAHTGCTVAMAVAAVEALRPKGEHQ